MKWILCAAVLLVACKERGTISIPLVEPCASTPTAVAIYLKPAITCDAIACSLRDFECSGDCIPLCDDGYCEMADVEAGLAVDPPEAGDYALIMSFRYDTAIDEGLTCFELKVDADGTSSSMLAAEEGRQECCIAP